MRHLFIATVCLALGWLAVDVPLDRANAEDVRKVIRTRMTFPQLRKAGLAVSPYVQPFPDSSCRSFGNKYLSISEDRLAKLEEAGFTLASACLAFSSDIRFNPATGRQLPLAVLPEGTVAELVYGDTSDQVPLEVPICFRNGVPDLECDMKYDVFTGTRNHLDPDDAAEHQEYVRRDDKLIRSFIEEHQLSGVFWRQDMNADSVFRDGGGRRHKFPDDILSLGNNSYKILLASPALSRGYGYALWDMGPQGGNDRPAVVDRDPQ
jgi:hypothetical protein